MNTPQVGTYVQATVDSIDDGDFRRKLEISLAEAYTALEEYEAKTGGKGGKVQLVTTVELNRKSEEHVEIEYAFSIKVPKVKASTFVRGVNGHLLVNPNGDSLNNKDQPPLPTFDKFGRPRAAINPLTGEVVPDEPEQSGVAGRVAGSA